MQTFMHQGDLGDVIYALPAIRAMGGGKIILHCDNGKTKLTQEKAEALAPLLSAQSYVAGVDIVSGPKAPACDHDLNRARARPEQHLVDQHLALFGLPAWWKDWQWLNAPPRNFGQAFFGNGSTTTGVLTHPGVLSPDAITRLREDWERLHRGPTNAGRVAVLEEGTTYTPISIPPDDAQVADQMGRDVEPAGHLVDLELARLQKLPVLFARSFFWRNPDMPWRELVDRYKGNACFVGWPAEHEAFCRDWGDVPYLPTRDFWELAQAIAGCSLFIGNQSAPYAVAEGLKHNAILETRPADDDCIFRRTNLLHLPEGRVKP